MDVDVLPDVEVIIVAMCVHKEGLYLSDNNRALNVGQEMTSLFTLWCTFFSWLWILQSIPRAVPNFSNCKHFCSRVAGRGNLLSFLRSSFDWSYGSIWFEELWNLLSEDETLFLSDHALLWIFHFNNSYKNKSGIY